MSSESTLGHRIEKSRTYKGLSVSQLAQRAGVNRKTLTNWEADRSTPRGDKAVRLAGILQVPLMWLLTGEDLAGAPSPPEAEETGAIADKLERAVAMQQTLATLLSDITSDVARLQRDLDKENDLAA